MGDFEFDAATALDGEGPSYDLELPDGWGADTVNGGFMLALLTRAMDRATPFPDPIVVSGLYLRPGQPGPASITTELIRAGRTTAFAQASLWREGKESLRATAAFSDLSKASGPDLAVGAAPDLPPPAECADTQPFAVRGNSIAERFDYRYAEPPGWIQGSPTGKPSAEFYMRFRDGREPDLVSLPLFVDAASPAIFEAGITRVTTIELTAHLRARPAPGWLRCRSATRFLSGGYHEEDFEAWDSSGTLVAQSRQLALVLK